MAGKFATYPSLNGRAVIVTGGASGIGAATARALVGQGARVGIIDRDSDRAAAMVDEFGSEVRVAAADLRDIDALKGAIAELAAAQGPAQVLVNNAANDDRHDWRSIEPAYWDERMHNNLRHMFFAIQAVAPAMAAAGGGSIINLGSNSWHETAGGFPAYATAKAAVEGLTRTMARELGRDNIRVNTVVPGWVMTERQKQLWVTPEKAAAQAAKQCLPRLIEPEDVARMILFLASDDAGACTAGAYTVTAGSM